MNVGQKAAIEVVKLAYNDCASFVDHLADGAIAGMPELTPREAMLAKIVFQMIASSIRKKADTCDLHFHLALNSEGSA